VIVKRMAMPCSFFICSFTCLQIRPGAQGRNVVESQLQQLLWVSKCRNGIDE